MSEAIRSFEDIEREVKAFEAAERARLGIEAPREPWRDANPRAFTASQRADTTILLGGLTRTQDLLVASALSGLGYRARALEVPDNDSLRAGKEFGNRGQCNPTWYTVGNLVKHLLKLRDEEGLAVEDVVRRYVFLTAGACGPCRFGTYATEYRKALRDAGFEGFRVLLFQQQGGLKQATGEAAGLDLRPRFFVQLLKALIAGDVLEVLGYRIRPYERARGATDAAIEHSREDLGATLERRGSVLLALRRARRRLAAVEVDWLEARPKVSVIGEFWAMTTEGDGNYRLKRFLEEEGAEVEPQPVTAWLLYQIWEHRHDTRRRLELREADGGRKGLAGKDPLRKLRLLALGERVIRGWFGLYARAAGLRGYHLPDMEEIASISHAYYSTELRGGEGHMEVGKLIQTFARRKAHLVVSVKPFGCMPSSSVSDGVQSLVVARHPGALFCAVETSGDAAVNFLSRVQMVLHKARRAAREELKVVAETAGLTLEEARARLGRRARSSLHHPPHAVAGTAANLVRQAAR